MDEYQNFINEHTDQFKKDYDSKFFENRSFNEKKEKILKKLQSYKILKPKKSFR